MSAIIQAHLVSGVVTIGSGISAVISGAFIQTSVSGNSINTSVSGNSVGTSISGNNVVINSGAIVNTSISGNIVLTSISGNSVNTSVSGNVVLTSISGNNVIINNGAFVQTSVSGNVVQASVSGNIIQTSVSGNVVQTSISGNFVQTNTNISGQIVLTSVSGNVVIVKMARTAQEPVNQPIVTRSGLTGNVQLTGGSGGTTLPLIDVSNDAGAAIIFGELQPYSGATATANFWVGGGGMNAPFFDPTVFPSSQGLKNPISIRPLAAGGATFLRAVTDQSGYFLSYFI